jgi:hypothetical protein
MRERVDAAASCFEVEAVGFFCFPDSDLTAIVAMSGVWMC